MAVFETKEKSDLPRGEEQKPLNPESDFFSPENQAESENKKQSEKKINSESQGPGVKAQFENQRRALTLLTAMETDVFPLHTFQKARRRFMIN